MHGTTWVAPGEGATVVELLNMRWEGDYFGYRATPTGSYIEAAEHLDRLWDHHGEGYRTNLALTGAPLLEYDLRRIAVCE